MTDRTEGLGASPNRFTQTDSSLEKDWEVVGNAEGVTPTAQPVGSMHETGCGKPPERRQAWLQAILLSGHLLLMQLQLSPPSAQECRGVTHTNVHREPEPTPPPAQRQWCHQGTQTGTYPVTSSRADTMIRETPGLPCCTSNAMNRREQNSITLEKTKFPCLTPSL